MKIIRNELQKECKFRDVEVGTIFKTFDSVCLFMKTKELNVYREDLDDCFFNVINLENFEIDEIQDFEDVVIFDKSFLTVE